MTQNTVAQAQKNLVSRRFALVPGLSVLGSLSILSGGMALAQTTLVIPEPASLPSDAIPTHVPQRPEVTPVAPEPLAPEFTPAAPQPARQKAKIPTVVLPGVNSSYDAPTSIVLSERSTGCQTVLRQGRAVPDGICPQVEYRGVSETNGRLTSSASVSALSVVSPSPNVWSYYKRTVRPPGRLGNGNIRLIFPLAIPAPISSLFGWRTHPITGDQRFHSGTDLAAPLGTPVLAAYAGRVAIADFLGGYGLAVSLEHNKGTQQTIYAHLSEIFVKPGEMVKQGEAIGRVGSTGNSTGPHLHFEFRQLTEEGWVAMDAGQQLEYSLAQLVKALHIAQAKPNNGTKG